MKTSRYGDIDLVRTDVRGRRVWSVDMRQLTDLDQTGDETCVVEPGTFGVALTAGDGDNLPIAEIVMRWQGVDVCVVAELTHREGKREVMPEHLQAAQTDPIYRRQLTDWLCSSRPS